MPTQIERLRFGLHPHQIDVLNAAFRTDAEVIWDCGGIGSGKTHALCHFVYRAMTGELAGHDGVIIEPDFATFEDVFLPVWRSLFPGEGRSWRVVRSRSSLILEVLLGRRGASRAFVRSAMNSQSVQRIDGITTAVWAAMDEPARMLCGQAAFEKALGRTRVPNPLGKNIVFIVGSPRGFNWVADAFGLTEDHPPHGWTIGYWPKDRYYVRVCRSVDNQKFLSDRFVERTAAAYGEAFAKQELEASLISAQGQIFPEYYRSVHVVPHAVALNLWRRKVRRPVGGIDWGFTNPAAVVAGGWTGDDELIIIDSWYQTGAKIGEIGAAAVRFRNEYGVSDYYCDPSEPEHIDTLLTGFDVDGRTERVTAMKAINDWQPGIDTLRHLMVIRRGLDHPAHPPGNGLGRPRLILSDTNVDGIREIPGYRQLEVKPGQPLREGAVGADHWIDATRYLAHSSSRHWEIKGYKIDY